jgi:predicted phage tail protein
MTHIKLMGEMGEKFGSEWECVDTNMRDILKCINVQTEGLQEYLLDCHLKNIEFSIQSGDTLIEEFPELYLNVARDEVIITPVPAGSGKGLGKLITGLLLLAALFFMPGLGAAFTTGGTTAGATTLTASGAGAFGTSMTASVAGSTVGSSVAAQITAGASLNLAGTAVMMLGANLALMGLAEMSAPDPDRTTDDPSYLFNGAQNHIEQGKPVPLLYGELTIGGAPIYQGYTPGLQNQYKKGVTLIDGNDTNHSRIGTNPYSGIYTNYATSNAGSPSNQPSSGWVGTGNNTFDQVIDYITTPSSGLAKTPLPDDIFEQAK